MSKPTKIYLAVNVIHLYSLLLYIILLLLGGTCPYERTEIDHWISCALVLQNKQINKELLNYLNNVLIARTWLVTKRLTLADIHVFCVLHRHEYIKSYAKDYCNITRWYKHMESLPAFNNAISMIAKNCSSTLKPKAISLQKEKSDVKQTKTRKQEGKFIDLPGAEMGKVKSYSTIKFSSIFKLL